MHVAGALAGVQASWDSCADVASEITCSLVERPPASIGESETIAHGVDAALDELRAIATGGKDAIASLQTAERAAHGNRIAESRLQQGLRLLHRSHEREHPPRAARLSASTDADRRRALRDAGAEGVRGQGAARHRAHRGARAAALRGAARTCRCADSQAPANRRASSRSSTSSATLAEVASREGYVRPEVGEGFDLEIIGRPPSGGGADDAARPVRPERRAALARGADDHPHRPEHGGEEHDPATDRPDRADGADGQLRPGFAGTDRDRRPRVHARRRERQPRARAKHFHGGDVGDERHPAHGDGAEPRPARRNRARHQHVGRREHRVGRERAPARTDRVQDGVRHALPRAHPARRRIRIGPQLQRRRARERRSHPLSAPAQARRRGPLIRYRSRPARRTSATGDRAGPRAAQAARRRADRRGPERQGRHRGACATESGRPTHALYQ